MRLFHLYHFTGTLDELREVVLAINRAFGDIKIFRPKISEDGQAQAMIGFWSPED